jgi:hypothetical protein
VSGVVAPTQLNQVDRCDLSTDFIHLMEEASFGTYLRTGESRGIAAPVSILCACLEKPILSTSVMKSRRSVCFSSFPCRYCLMNSGEPSGVP